MTENPIEKAPNHFFAENCVWTRKSGQMAEKLPNLKFYKFLGGSYFELWGSI